ncbi:MAG: SDR family oxidoreductase [Chitinophagaceae bacterium]|nr:SDR family oxidoreductase [Chitinophagaceae bacterium]
MSKKVLVTGATGSIATLAIPSLIENGLSVRAFVRNAKKAENLKKLGVEIFEGDLSNQEEINEAAKGMDSILSLTAAGPDAVAQASAITKAAKQAGAKHLIRLSAIKAAEDAPTENGRFHFQTDKEIIASGIPYTILRPHFFMQNLFMSVPTILEQGNMYWGMGQGKLGMIDVRDIADCIVSLLTNGGHEGEIYNPTGASSITFTEAAAIISKGIGKPVNYISIPIEAVGQALRSMGQGEWVAKLMMDYSKAYSANWGDYANDDVTTITGRKARTFQQFFDEVLSWGFKQPAKSNETVALA